MTETVWQCEQWRAGEVYNKLLFNTEREAEEFLQQMRRSDPDLFWKKTAVPAKAVWN
jgi:hypothetical protein